MNSSVEAVQAWAIKQALKGADIKELFFDCCERLHKGGIALDRGHIAFRMVHPLHNSIAITWKHDELPIIDPFAHGQGMTVEFKVSPLYHLITSRQKYMRRKLVGDDAELDYALLQELSKKGYTDYFSYQMSFGGDPMDGMLGSWATMRPEGFRDEDIEALMSFENALGICCKALTREEIAKNIVTTYLGPNAGPRVLRGQIHRGDAEVMRGALWYSDLRRSTQIADQLSPEEFADTLNEYFGCSAGAAIEVGGDVATLVGDAVLAIFPSEEGREREVCRKVMLAAKNAQKNLFKVNDARRASDRRPINFGLGVHFGSFMYGNVGVPERLTSSVFGSAVNEVARLENLTKTIGSPMVASEAFAQFSPEGLLVPLGSEKIRGIEEPIEVYGLPENKR